MTHNPHGKLHNVLLSGFLIAAVCMTAIVGSAQEVLPPISEVEAGSLSDDDFELLTRGPLHEAFATSAPLEPQPGIVVQKQPPADIQELPPTHEAVDSDEQEAVWIPGYWSWDEEREDFVWVSGAWRIPPIDRRWVPGYWNETNEGWQWVSGFWAPAAVEELDYVKPPPPTLETGPSIPAPSQNHFWIPGSWVYRSHEYNWRPGYWCPFEEDRVWIPAHYVWTPSGCLFVDGYWDYVLPRRGYLYAPVYFHRPVTYYRPSCGIQLSNLLLHLFVSPHHYGYFFGDYYDHGYHHRGRYPLYQHHLAARHYDPLLTYYDVHYGRHGIDARARFRGWHKYYSSHPHHRPPRTWSAQLRFTHDKDAHRYHSRTVLANAPKRHRGGDERAHHDGRSERHRIKHEQFREMAKHRKDVEARRIERLADSDEGARQLRLPRQQRRNRRNGGLDIVNADASERTRPRDGDRINAGRAGIRASSLGDPREIGNADRNRKRGKEDVAGKSRNRLDGPSPDTVDVGPQVRAALQDRKQIGALLKSRDAKKFNRQLGTDKNVLSLEPAQGSNHTAVPRASREKVEQRIPQRAVDTGRANNARAESGSSSLERRATNKTSFRTENAAKQEIRQRERSLPPTSRRAVVDKRQPAGAIQLRTPQADPKSSAKSSTQSDRSTRNRQQRSSLTRGNIQRQLDAGRARQKVTSASPSQQPTSPRGADSTRNRQQRSFNRGDVQRQLDAGRARQNATSASLSQQPTLPRGTDSTRNRQQRSFNRGDVQRQPDAGRARQKASSTSRRQQTITRTAPQQRQPARTLERRAAKTQAPARAKTVSSSRNKQQSSSFSGRDFQRQPSASRSRQQSSVSRSRQQSSVSRSRQQSSVSRSRQQSSASRVKQPARAPSYKPSAGRSRASSARSVSQSRQPKRSSVSRQSSSRQKSSANRQRQSRSSNGRSGGKKKSN